MSVACIGYEGDDRCDPAHFSRKHPRSQPGTGTVLDFYFLKTTDQKFMLDFLIF
jgi:hypothetical protein